MAKVLGVFYMERKPETTDADVEAFAAQLARDFKVPGVQGVRSAIGDRGQRTGKYLFMWEFDSVATRDRYFPVAGGAASDEWQRLTAAYPWWGEKTAALFTEDFTFTDYVVIGPIPFK